MVKRAWHVLLTLALVAAILPGALAAQPREAPDEFLPIGPGDLPEELPAAPLVFAAYAVVWLVFGFYLFTLWRRVRQVDDELRTVTHRLERDGR